MNAQDLALEDGGMKIILRAERSMCTGVERARAFTGFLNREKSHRFWRMLKLGATSPAGRRGGTLSPNQLLVQILSYEEPKVLGDNPILCLASLKLYHENKTF